MEDKCYDLSYGRLTLKDNRLIYHCSLNEDEGGHVSPMHSAMYEDIDLIRISSTEDCRVHSLIVSVGSEKIIIQHIDWDTLANDIFPELCAKQEISRNYQIQKPTLEKPTRKQIPVSMNDPANVELDADGNLIITAHMNSLMYSAFVSLISQIQEYQDHDMGDQITPTAQSFSTGDEQEDHQIYFSLFSLFDEINDIADILLEQYFDDDGSFPERNHI